MISSWHFAYVRRSLELMPALRGTTDRSDMVWPGVHMHLLSCSPAVVYCTGGGKSSIPRFSAL